MERRLNTSIIGTTGPDPQYWPDTVFSSDAAQSLVLALAEGACSHAELSTRLGLPDTDLQAALTPLRGIGAVREGEDGLLSLDFSLLTRQDQVALDELVPPLAEALADSVGTRWPVIQAALRRLAGTPTPRSQEEFAFATVGCMGLDWDGIATLRQCGFLSAPRDYPDGGRYVLTGEERRGVPAAKDYCGSHTAGGERYFFTNFGDHSGPRHSLPDLFFRAQYTIGKASWPKDLGAALSAVVEHGFGGLYDELGAIVALRPQTPGPCADFLRRLGYLGSGEALVPVFIASMVEPVQEIISSVREAVVEWAARTVPSLKERMGPLTPLRHGVDEGHFLNHIWHFIFADANRVLCERGMMLDPEPKPNGQGRYLSWIAEAEFYRAIWPSPNV